MVMIEGFPASGRQAVMIGSYNGDISIILHHFIAGVVIALVSKLVCGNPAAPRRLDSCPPQARHQCLTLRSFEEVYDINVARDTSATSSNLSKCFLSFCRGAPEA